MISNAFATTIDEGMAEAPYQVSAVDDPIEYIDDGVLEVLVCPEHIASAASVGDHAGTDIALPIDFGTGLVEPRVQGGGGLWIDLTFAGDVDAGLLSVAMEPDPGVSFDLSPGVSSSRVELHFDADVPTGRYVVTIEGDNCASSFPICYAKGDVNCSGDATGLDLGAIQSPTNWNKTLAEGASPRADVNRDGQATGLDLGQVQSPTSWNQPVPALTCGCP
jgi:hypothetical protein